MLQGRRRSESQRVELVRCRRGLVFDSVELAFADHVHDLDAGDQDAGAKKGLESEHRPGDAFDGAVVLLDEVVQVLRKRGLKAPLRRSRDLSTIR